MDVKDYKELFEQSSELVVVMDTNFTVVAASDAYLKVTKTIREDITGKNIFDIFPDNPNDITADGAGKMRASFNRVIINKKADTLAILKYDIPKPQSEGGGFEVKYWRTVNSPMPDTNNKLEYIIQRSEDVTENEALTTQLGEEKKALKKIEESNKRYHAILMESPFAFSIMKGKDMVVTLANNLIKQIWGKGDDVEGKTLLQVLPELKDQPFPAMLDTVYTTGNPVYANEILARLNHNGKIEDRYFNIVYQPYLEADETISGVITIAHEVTNQALARKRIQESEQRFQGAVAAVEGNLWTNNAKGEMVGEQLGWASLTGQSYEEYQGYGWVKAVHPDDAQPTVEAWNNAVLESKNFVFEHRILLKNGNWGHFSIRAVPLFNPDGSVKEWVGVHTNITEQRQAEESLKNTKEQLELIFNNILAAVYLFSNTGQLIFLNDKAAKIFGDYNTKEILAQKDLEGVLKKVDEIFERFDEHGQPFNPKDSATAITMRTGKPAQSINKIINRHSKEISWQLLQSAPYTDEAGNLSKMLVTSTDITIQKTAEEKIKESEHRYHNLVYSSPSMICILKGEDMIIEIANDSILESWGKGKDIIGKPILKVMHEIVEQGFDKLLLSVYKTGTPVQAYEIPVTLIRNGAKELVYYNFIYQAQRNVNGEIEGVAIIATEVTPQALLNKKIKESEAFNRAVLESSPDCIKMLDAEGRLEFMNSNGICLLEIDDFKSVQNTHWWDMYEPENRQIIKDAVANAKSGENVQFQIFSPTTKGTPKWWDIIVLPVQEDGTGEMLPRILSVSRDITEQKKVEEAIRENETRFRSIANASTAALWMSDENFQFTYVNQTWIDWTGQPFEKHLGEGWIESILPEDQQPTREQIVKNFTARRNFKMDFRMKRADGKIRWCVSEGAPRYLSNGQFAGYAGTCNDITERKQNELKEKLILSRFQNLVQQAPVAICVLRGKDYVIETINEGMFEMWDRKLEETINKPVFDVLPELRGQGFEELLDNVYDTGERFVAEELPIQYKRNGKLENAFVKFIYEPLREADGTISGVMALAHEITEQVVARKTIEAQAAMFENMLMTLPAFVCTLKGPDHVFDLVNPNYQKLIGKRQVQGKRLLDALPELTGQGFDTLLDKVFTTGEPFVGIDIPTMLAPDENTEPALRYFNFYYQPMYDENKNIYSVLDIGFDVTEQVIAKNKNLENEQIRLQELEEKVQQRTLQLSEANAELQKMNKELNSFTYISSHDLQEPLRKIKTFTKLISENEKENLSGKGKDYFNRINNAASRMQTLIEDLLLYSQTNSAERKFEVTSLHEIVSEVKNELAEIIQEKNAIIEGDNLARLSIIPFQFRQLFSNLITNSLKFVLPETAPHIIIKTEVGTGSKFINEMPAPPTDSLLPQKNYCHITISDNGIGFSPEYKDRIFEIFQRLHGKEQYAGTGIGLAIVKKIVENHKGIIIATSELNKGARFDIYIPEN